MLKLKELRKKYGLTQQNIADKLNVQRTTITNYENGTSEPDIEALNKLADIFNVSIDYLLNRNNIETTKSNINKNLINLINLAQGERTLNQFALHIGLAPATVSLIKNGKRNPSPKTLLKISKNARHNVTYEDLMKAAGFLNDVNIVYGEPFMQLKETRIYRGYTQQEVANKLNLSVQAYSHYETGRRKPDYKTLKKLADFFNVSIDYLLGRENVESIKLDRNVVQIPVFGEIPAGIPIEMIEDSFIEDIEEIDANLCRGDNHFFGLKIKGDSMFPKFEDGDIVIFKQQDTCENGDFCAVSINHTECTFKKVLKKESGITLMPLNPDYEPIFFTNEEVADLPITILGVVKEVRRSFK